ncbi:MAG: hypothetical protein AAF625_09510 [Pseudomonadota bacterium]
MIRVVVLAFTFLFACSFQVLASAEKASYNLFSTQCVNPLTNGTDPDVSQFHEWSDQEVLRLSAQTGLRPEGFRFWTPNGTEDILVWSETDPVCQVLHFGFQSSSAEEIWAMFEADASFRTQPFVSSDVSSEGLAISGFASKKTSGNRFVQVTVMFRDYKQPGATIVMLTAVNVGPSPASCDLFPEECE